MIKSPINRILEQDDFLVIDKPAGIPVHREQDQPGILEYLESDKKLYLCHRLDKATSGLLLIAKTQQAAAELSQQFEQKLIQKYYLAISDKRPKKSQGLISGDMVKSRQGSWKLTKNQSNPALTQFLSRSHSPGFRSFLLKPHTGKTHQLRVSLAAMGAQILGDVRYKGSSADRMYLHAYQLQFVYQQQIHIINSQPLVGELFPDFIQGVDDPWLEPQNLLWPKLKTGSK